VSGGENGAMQAKIRVEGAERSLERAWQKIIERVLRERSAEREVAERSRSFKVPDFGTNRKLIYDFLLVINRPTNFLLSCTVSKLWLIVGHIFASERGVPHFNALAGIILC